MEGSWAHPGLLADFLRALPVERASVSTFTSPFDVETLDASDDLAAHVSELQLDMGEGPGWDACTRQANVLVPFFDAEHLARWPLFASAVVALGVQAIYSFPLAVGTVKIGSVDLLAGTPRTVTAAHVVQATALLGSTSADILRHAMDHRYDDPGPQSRRETHQATGVVVAQMGLSPADALLIIRAHAFATDRSVREVAADIVARRLSFTP